MLRVYVTGRSRKYGTMSAHSRPYLVHQRHHRHHQPPRIPAPPVTR